MLMVGTGYATGILAGLPEIVFAGTGAPLPAKLRGLSDRQAHGYWRRCWRASSLCTLGAALYHQVGQRDGLLRRMGFGRLS